MTKNGINFIATIALTLILALVLPWWSIMVAAFITSLVFPLKRFAVFFVPFLAILLLWSIYSFVLSSGNNFILAKRIATLLPLNGNPYILVIVTGLIGGIAAGITAIFGKQIQLLQKIKNK